MTHVSQGVEFLVKCRESTTLQSVAAVILSELNADDIGALGAFLYHRYGLYGRISAVQDSSD